MDFRLQQFIGVNEARSFRISPYFRLSISLVGVGLPAISPIHPNIDEPAPTIYETQRDERFAFCIYCYHFSDKCQICYKT